MIDSNFEKFYLREEESLAEISIPIAFKKLPTTNHRQPVKISNHSDPSEGQKDKPLAQLVNNDDTSVESKVVSAAKLVTESIPSKSISHGHWIELTDWLFAEKNPQLSLSRMITFENCPETRLQDSIIICFNLGALWHLHNCALIVFLNPACFCRQMLFILAETCIQEKQLFAGNADQPQTLLDNLSL